ncbi:MAG: amidinotransferase [Chloroflexi bacterium]|nr:amidinotransferase [Chloroflexota bacterium]
MCPATYFDIEYEINPWMRLSRQVDRPRAQSQWQELHRVLTAELGVTVELMEPVRGLPDLVFTANAGYVSGRVVLSSNFKYPQRRGETPHFEAWFLSHGYRVHRPAEECFFEGAGDALPLGEAIFAGYRHRSEICSHQKVATLTGRQVLSLELVDSAFYHLDTCFCPLGNGAALYYPGAFDAYARTVIEANVPRPIAVAEQDARLFACNAVVVGRTVVLNAGCADIEERLRKAGYSPRAMDLSEFMKSGGSAKCLTLLLE